MEIERAGPLVQIAGEIVKVDPRAALDGLGRVADAHAELYDRFIRDNVAQSNLVATRDIFAGSDFTLMPSRFEPCGLSQMYAQKFGSLPIGHQTGGLAETIVDGETGFLFKQPSAESFLGGIRRAFTAFVAKDRLDSMRRSAMARSFSWGISAACYSALYRKTVSS